MIFEIELNDEELEEVDDIVATYNKEHPEAEPWTRQTWIARQIFIPLQERVDQQYVGLARLMSREEKKAALGNLKDVKAKIKKRQGQR